MRCHDGLECESVQVVGIWYVLRLLTLCLNKVQIQIQSTLVAGCSHVI